MNLHKKQRVFIERSYEEKDVMYSFGSSNYYTTPNPNVLKSLLLALGVRVPTGVDKRIK